MKLNSQVIHMKYALKRYVVIKTDVSFVPSNFARRGFLRNEGQEEIPPLFLVNIAALKLQHPYLPTPLPIASAPPFDLL